MSEDPTNVAVTFYQDIEPLFRPMDVQCMRGLQVLLKNYEWMSTPRNAEGVYGRLRHDNLALRMPLGGPYWTDENIALFKTWMDGGYQKGTPPDAE